jgi:hypothetical protein
LILLRYRGSPRKRHSEGWSATANRRLASHIDVTWSGQVRVKLDRVDTAARGAAGPVGIVPLAALAFGVVYTAMVGRGGTLREVLRFLRSECDRADREWLGLTRPPTYRKLRSAGIACADTSPGSGALSLMNSPGLHRTPVRGQRPSRHGST